MKDVKNKLVKESKNEHYDQLELAQWVFSHNCKCPHCGKGLCITLDKVEVK